MTSKLQTVHWAHNRRRKNVVFKAAQIERSPLLRRDNRDSSTPPLNDAPVTSAAKNMDNTTVTTRSCGTADLLGRGQCFKTEPMSAVGHQVTVARNSAAKKHGKQQTEE
jgi:hypothetical protein